MVCISLAATASCRGRQNRHLPAETSESDAPLRLKATQSTQPVRPAIDRCRNQAISVRREKVLVHSGTKDPPGNWIAPPGSNRSGGGGNEAAEASGGKGRIRRLGESAGCTRVNAEQASKLIMQELTHL